MTISIPPLVFSVRELSIDGLGVVADIVTSVHKSTANRTLQMGGGRDLASHWILVALIWLWLQEELWPQILYLLG